MTGLRTGGFAEYFPVGAANPSAMPGRSAVPEITAAGDSLNAIQESLGMEVNSALGAGATPTDTLSVSAQHIFGPHSDVLTGDGFAGMPAAPDTFLTGGLVFDIMALACFAVYCLSIYFHSQQVLTVVGIFRSKLYVENLLGEHNYTFDNYLNIAASMGLLAVSLALVRAADIFAGADIAGAAHPWVVQTLVLLTWGAFGAVFLYQYVALKLVGWLTGSQKFVSRLRYLRKINFTLLSVVLTPLLLMFSLADERGIYVIAVLLSAGLFFVCVFFLIRTYILFVDEKISKLYWFLYLCAVEIFPVTLLVFSILKYLL